MSFENTRTSKVIFDFFDHYYTNNISNSNINDSSNSNDSMDIQQYQPLPQSKIHQARETDDGDSHQEDIFSTSSTTSVNSLFDFPTASTSTTTPILSRNESMKQKFINPGYKLTPSIEEFTTKLDKKLNQQLRKTTINSNSTTSNTNNKNASTNTSTRNNTNESKSKLVVLLVGLPASGKSTLCHQLNSYINNYTQYTSRIYNAGDVRRRKSLGIFNDSRFFDPKNKEARQDRELYASIAITNLIKDITSPPQNKNSIDIGFFDATNTTKDRRQRMLETIHTNNTQNVQLRTVILDVQCNNQHMIDYNICQGKVYNADYANLQSEKSLAVRDFKQRLQHYREVYEPVSWQELDAYDDQELITAYVKCINAGEVFDVSLGKNVTAHEEEEAEEEEELDGWYIKIIEQFRTRYYETEGKKYHDQVKEWEKLQEYTN